MVISVTTSNQYLVNKDIFLGVVPVDESISRLDVEPFHRAAHLAIENQHLSKVDLIL